MNNLFIHILQETWFIIATAGPFILFGFVMAGLIHTFIPPAKIVSFLGQRNWKSVVTASICGIPLPLCSCSVLPTAATLREKGASRGAATSFLISTPETGVDSIAMTYGIMDGTMTVLRPLAAFVTALLSGLCVNVWGGPEEEPIRQEAPSCCCSSQKQTSHCESTQQTKRPWWLETFKYAFGDLSNGLSHWLALGLILSGIISTCIPDTVFEGWIGQGTSSLILMLAVSMPMYICASASTPIAAVMIAKGLSPGAAIVFLLAGPATNIGSIPVLIKILGKRSTLLYLISIIVVSLIVGYGVNLYYASGSITPTMAIHEHGGESGGAIGVAAALFLLALLVKGIAFRPIPTEWRKLNDRFASLTGFRLNWTIWISLILILAALSLLWPMI